MWNSLPQFVSAIVAVLGLIVAALGLFAVWVKWRESQLRRSDVLAWSNQAISAMKTLHLICEFEKFYFSRTELDAKLKELCFRTSILIEQGRLFFHNVEAEGYGQEKEPAYRGYRPRVLDHLLVAHRIALGWSAADAESRKRMCLVAKSQLQEFVSLIQKEVGRSRTASAETQRPGERIDLKALMDEAILPKL